MSIMSIVVKTATKIVLNYLQSYECWKDENSYRGCLAYDCDRGYEWENIGEED